MDVMEGEAVKVNKNWTTEDGNHDGGQSYGPGFCIAWQRGPTKEVGQNGAFIVDVLEACLSQIEYFQDGKYQCEENEMALGHLVQAIEILKSRKARREAEGKYGTAEV